MRFSKADKVFFLFSFIMAGYFLMPHASEAMHIMEGFLPGSHALLWGAICIPFLAYGLMKMKAIVKREKRAMVLLAMSGAVIFVLSSLKIPSVTGSCSHMTGTGMGAILFGPAVTSVLGIIVLLFQAILLAHGGLTTLGANTFSMAIGGPIISWLLYKLGKNMKLNRKVNVFIAVALGDLFTYCITSFQLAFAYPAVNGGVMGSVAKFLGIFAATQVPLAIIEGLISVMIIMGLEELAKPELEAVGYLGGK